ncbi:MAG: methyltransferase [Novosphingobium sp.]
MSSCVRLIALSAVLSALLLAPPVEAKPTPIFAALADPARSDKDRAKDEGRMPAAILEFAGIKRGQVIADVFAGGGYYTVLLSDLTGPMGTVYALNPPGENDAKVWPTLLPTHKNIRLIVAPVTALQMGPRSLDVLFSHLNYHDLYWESTKYGFTKLDVPAVLSGWFSEVKPGGHVVIVDHVGPAGDTRAIVDKMHRIDPDRVKADMAAAGFVLESESNVLHRSEDGHDKGVFDATVRGKTDRFVMKFKRP